MPEKVSKTLMIAAALASGVFAHAYTLTETNGNLIRWRHGQKYFLVGNPTNQKGIAHSAVWEAVVNGLQQWKRATQGMFDFEYWQGTDTGTYKTQLAPDGTNALFFASQSNNKSDPNVIGYTQVWYNTNTGELLEADIILNDRDYELTSNASDTSSRSRSARGSQKVFVNNVITHELGHAMGLSHSSQIQSTMLYVEYTEQSKLSCDDWSAAKHLYPFQSVRASENNPQMGSLTGVIGTRSGHPASGVVVTAISNQRGVPVASVHTNQNGVFEFGALEPGSVSLMVEPFQGPDGAIPTRHQAKNKYSICGSEEFPANFITESNSNLMRTFQVAAGKITAVGNYQIQCEEPKDAGTNVFLPDNANAFVDRAQFELPKYYSFYASGNFKITGLGYLLMSKVHVSLEMEGQTHDILYRSRDSDLKIEDSAVKGSAFGLVTIKATPAMNEARNFPGPSIHASSSPYYVINIIREPDRKPHPKSLPNHARCMTSEPFPEYQSPGRPPLRNAATTTTRDGIGFCGSAHAAEVGVTNPTASWGGIIGWFFPFLIAWFTRSKLRA